MPLDTIMATIRAVNKNKSSYYTLIGQIFSQSGGNEN